MPAKQVLVDKLPKCSIHTDRDAHFDFASTMGPWMYGCELCFAKYGRGLGVGKGQQLVLRQPPTALVKPDLFVTLTVHASQVESLMEMLKNEKMERVKEVGFEVAEATEEVRLIHDLFQQIERQTPPEGF